MASPHDETELLLPLAANGDAASWRALVALHEKRLRALIELRLDERVRVRVGPSDVLQETYLEAWRSLSEYLREPIMPFYLWLRGIAGNKLRELHRRHLGAHMRDARRDVSLYHGALPGATSAVLAAQLLGRFTGPNEAAIRAEMKTQLEEALNRLEPIDREVLVLRHFEHLTPAETAQVLGIKEKAGGMRYVRALRRLKLVLLRFPE